ncbi:unnamed protein product [Lepeophtheirus salmonis]|uniref:(salmon louse) hypothetical protein n=1 Tax=Lepeophtheirus salmonis TaxID=72036 RepID=A0A7R8CGR1_LEPSM|nr:unnamed protein product [Lepeophtheirus salmonis]CAF2813163.1 unnamed protein product [Lepeophtheirus salmonis]
MNKKPHFVKILGALGHQPMFEKTSNVSSLHEFVLFWSLESQILRTLLTVMDESDRFYFGYPCVNLPKEFKLFFHQNLATFKQIEIQLLSLDLDTGATYRNVTRKSVGSPSLKKDSWKYKSTTKHSLPIIGRFLVNTWIHDGDDLYKILFTVSEILYSNLMGSSTIRELGISVDDVGRDDEHYKNNLENLLQRLEDNGLRCRIEKYQLAKLFVEYLGNVLLSEGIVKGPKVDAIINIEQPSDVSGLEPFLGSVKKTINHTNADVLSPLPFEGDTDFDDEGQEDVEMVMRFTREGWIPKSYDDDSEFQRFRQISESLSVWFPDYESSYPPVFVIMYLNYYIQDILEFRG